MKILLINTTHDIGSTGKLTKNFYEYLKNKNHDVSVIAGYGSGAEDSEIHIICARIESKVSNFLGRITGLNGCFSFAATQKAKRILQEFNPDIVYLGNLHGHYINIYKLYKYLRKLSKPIIKIMWDEYAMTGGCAFSFECESFKGKCRKCSHIHDYPKSLFLDTSYLLQKMKKRAYCNQKIAFVGVPYTADKARLSSLLSKYRIYSLDEAVDQTGLYYPRNSGELRKELRIDPNKKVILNVCPYPDERKGGKYFIELAKACINIEDIIFVHVGFMGNKEECPDNYIPIGYIRDQTLMACYYSMADLFVCTSIAETQPNTCIEALSCGTKICGFNISGIPTCASKPYGEYVEVGDINGLKHIILNTHKKNIDSIEEVRNYALTRFDSKEYNRKLLEIGDEIIKGIEEQKND